MQRLTPPFCGIRTSVVSWLSIQCVCSPMPCQKKRAGDVLGYGFLEPLWDRHWGRPRRWCFRPPALGGGGVAGWCGDLSRPGGCRVGLCRRGFLWGRGGFSERARFRCAGTGVHTLWCPLWQQWRTPLCLRVHLGHGGRLCNGHSCSCGLRATCSSAWWPSLQHSSAVRRRRLHVMHAETECAEHCV